jgi:hypothetical protein
MAAVVFLTIAACSLFLPLPPANPSFHKLEEIQSDLVTLGWLRPGSSGTNQPLLVVIEGDGAAWSGDKTAPSDPTPRSGAGARLASALVNGGSVLYLARPGQYLSAEQAARCSIHYWTDQRFGHGPVTALGALIDRAQMVGQKVILIGFSGGGVLAAELAVRRNDVVALITVAAPLDLDGWTRLHNISPLARSSRVADLPASLGQATFAQRHFYGARDRVVPPILVAPLSRQLPAGTVRLLEGMGHDDDWATAVMAELRSLRLEGGAGS